MTAEPIAERLARLTPAQRAALLQQIAVRDKGVVRREHPYDPLPLSPAQLRLWFLEQLQPGTGSYHVLEAARMRGALDREALARAVREMAARHEILRTSFGDVDGTPYQRVHEHVDIAVENIQASEDDARRVVTEAAFRPFDLTRAPLWRVVLVTIDDDDHVLLVAMHHIITDAWSLDGIFASELAALYNAFRRGEPSPLPHVPLHFGDVVLWEQSALQQTRVHEDVRWWTERLRGVPDALDLPSDRPRPATQTFRGARHRFSVAPEITAPLLELARREHATPFMVVLAAFETLLHRWSQQSEFAVGTPVANRRGAEVEPIVGFFVNTVAMRADLNGDPDFRALLRRVRDEALDAFAHQHAPFERVVDSLGLERSTNRSPLFQTMLVVWNGGPVTRAFDGVTCEPFEADHSSARFDVTLALSIGDAGIDAVFDYATDLFDAATIDRLARHFTNLLRAIGASPETPVSRLPLIDDEERAELLCLARGPRRDFPHTTLHDLFAQQAERTPDAPAIIAPDRTITYAELSSRASVEESPSHFIADRSPEAIVTLMAILKSGRPYIPIDPSTPADRREWMINDSAGVSGAAYVIYTSGSTGKPKGVVVDHAAAVNLTLSFIEIHDFRAGDRVLMIPPLAFDASVGDVFPVLATGGALVLHPNPAELDARALARFCAEHGVTAIDAPAALWRRWVEEWVDIPALTIMMVGGEAVPLEQVRRFARLTRNRVRFFNHYGPTEATVCATVCSTIDGSEFATTELPIGTPIANVAAYVVDQHLQPVPIGVAGELCLGGAGVARYLNRPEESAERFVADPFARDARMYRTGDLVRRLADGSLLFLGRGDRQIKLRGYRIEPGEIETAILAFDGVREVFVTAREQKLVAYVVGTIDSSALRAFLQERLPSYMVPAAFVMLETLPLTSNGKVDQRALPVPEYDTESRAIVEPRNDVERALVETWRELLRVERIGVDDDFFALGGDSLRTMPLVSRIKQRFGVELPLSAVFQSPTVAQLAKLVTGEAQSEAISLESRIGEPIAVDPHAQPATFAAPRAVLVTGATGFLGAYLVDELLRATGAQIFCLVRASSDDEGRARIEKNLAAYGLLRGEDRVRLTPVRGDLARPRLGLDDATWSMLEQTIDVIYHNGSTVNFVTPYEKLEAPNVEGTREVLRLASRTRIKPVHFVSTLSVIDFDTDVVRESDPLPSGDRVSIGYNQSKWVADKVVQLARANGLPVSIYRPARITGDSRGGAWNTTDFFPSWIKGCVQLGAVADTGEEMNMSPVDFVAAGIVRLSLDPRTQNGDYHFFNNRRMPIARFAERLSAHGFAVERVPYSQWRASLHAAVARGEENALAPFVPFFGEDAETKEPRFDTTHTDAALAAVGLVCPPADDALVATYLDALSERGFLAVPVTQEEI